VLPALERHHDVLAPTLPGHAGGPSLTEPVSATVILEAIERAMDRAGFETAHIVGNSLGGFLAFGLATRGRARSVVALAPAGGWAAGDESRKRTISYFPLMQKLVRMAIPSLDAIVASEEGRRRATLMIASHYEHIPRELIAHQLLGAASCNGVQPLTEHALREGYELDAARIACPVRIVWGTDDKLLPWPSAATRYRTEWLPHADWVVLDGVGHCPQLDAPRETAALIVEFTHGRLSQSHTAARRAGP